MVDLANDVIEAHVYSFSQAFNQRGGSFHENTVAIAVNLIAIVPPKQRKAVGPSCPIISRNQLPGANQRVTSSRQ